MRVLVTGATGLIGSRGLRRAARPRRRGRRPQPRPGEGAQDQPDRHLARLGPGQRAPAGRGARGRRRGRQPGRRGDQPAAHRRGQAADPREPRAGDQEPRRRRCWPRRRSPRALVSQAAIGYLRRPRRGDRRRVDRRRPGLPRAARASTGRPRPAGPSDGGVRLVILRTGLVLDPDGGLLEAALPPFKLGVGGPLAGGALLHALDPPRRRGRADPLGARQRSASAAP